MNTKIQTNQFDSPCFDCWARDLRRALVLVYCSLQNNTISWLIITINKWTHEKSHDNTCEQLLRSSILNLYFYFTKFRDKCFRLWPARKLFKHMWNITNLLKKIKNLCTPKCLSRIKETYNINCCHSSAHTFTVFLMYIFIENTF